MTGQEAHPDEQTVAEFRDGLVHGQRAAWLAEHLARCPRCGTVPARLDEVTAMLAAAPAPAMPADVTRRLTDVLAAEAAGRAAAAVRDGATSVEGSHRGPARRRGPRRRFTMPKLLIPVAVAACLLLAGGGIFLTKLGGVSPSVGSSSSKASPRPSVVMPGAQGPIRTSQGVSGTRTQDSGTNYEPATLRAQVRSQIAHSTGVVGNGAGSSVAAPQGCEYQVTHGVRPVFVDTARYQGKPAVIIATSTSVWVVAPACDSSHPRVIAHQLLAGLPSVACSDTCP